VDSLRRIDRGAAWTLVGNLLNIVPTLLELVLLRKYGLEIWGEFLAAQAVVFVAGRVTCLGLDKSMLWYLPTLNRASRGVRRPAWGAAFIAAAFGTSVGLLLAWPLLHFVLPRGTQSGLAQWVLLAIPFFSASEVFIGALQGIQKFHYRPLLRDLGASAFLAPVALSLSFVPGIGARSLGIGFFVGHASIAILSAWFWSKESSQSRHGPLVPTASLMRYTLPIWLADSASSASLRASLLLLSRLAAPGVVGAFGVVQMTWQTATLARRAFETPLVALTADSPASAIETLYRQVVRRVLFWQIPLVILASAAGGDILRLISPRLGTIPEHLGLLWLVSCSFLASGPLMGQQVLAGLGKSMRLLCNNLLGMTATIGLLWLLAPRYGLLGACLAQGGAMLLSSWLGARQIREFAKLPAFPGRYAFALILVLVPATALAMIWCAMTAASKLPWPAWSIGLILVLTWGASISKRPKD
jgi:O-antigen/teichoic acid export membrane protein